jgi:hypothetical protein
MNRILLIGAFAVAAYFLLGMQGGGGSATTQMPNTTGTQYTGNASTWTREQVSKWSKTMMIEYGFWDSATNATTPAFAALPSSTGGF